MSDTSDPADGPELPQPLGAEVLCVPVTAADFGYSGGDGDRVPVIGIWPGKILTEHGTADVPLRGGRPQTRPEP